MLILNYGLAILITTIINTIPFFMPETWLVLSFFYIHYHLSFMIVVLIGMVFGTLGRVVLALFSRRYLYRIIPSKMLKNFQDLGYIFSNPNRSPILNLLTYVFLPLPENQVFIAAGLANVRLQTLIYASIIRNLVVYSFWIKTTSVAINSLQSLFSAHGTLVSVMINIFSFCLLLMIGSIPWGKIIQKKS